MNQGNVKLISILSNIMFLAILVYVQYDSGSQAQEVIDARKNQRNKYLAMHQEYFTSNLVLFDLAVEIQMSDKDSRTIAKLINRKRIPGRQAEDAYLKTTANPGNKPGRSVGYTTDYGAYYGFNIVYKEDIMHSLEAETIFWWD
jgi:hypothetical protein